MPLPNPNIYKNPIDYLDYSIFYIETYFNDIYITCGTAFAYEKSDKVFLVTNWHILSGRNPIPNKDGIYHPGHKDGAVPNKIKIWIYGWKQNGQIYTGFGGIYDLPIIDSDGNPLFVSKQLGNAKYIDVAILPLNGTEFKLPTNGAYGRPLCVNNAYSETFESKYILHPTDDVFIIGFPFGKIDDRYRAIWKRGSIAESFGYGNTFLVDTATRSGMSGSPVFHITTDLSFLKISDKIDHTERAYKVEFIGIYSGRIVNEGTKEQDSMVAIKKCDLDMAAQLGIVWKKDVIDSLI